MSLPETCGSVGGAISLWINVIDCRNGAGIISSRLHDVSQGIGIYCSFATGYIK